ncbi:hypothetical protein L1887_30512 [Cichorium endivia]|nr:hypothetical protein L1887_30512 [Cichorium endivia]
MVHGESYNIGVVEYTDDWSPFSPIPFDNVEDVDDIEETDNEDDEGLSNIWENSMDEDTELEDGEIQNDDHVGCDEEQLRNMERQSHNDVEKEPTPLEGTGNNDREYMNQPAVGPDVINRVPNEVVSPPHVSKVKGRTIGITRIGLENRNTCQ